MVTINDLVTVNIQCISCHNWREVSFQRRDYDKWQGGELIQNAFPYLNADDREMIKTHICPKCWNDMFGDDDE